jgi:AbrB family looped-hinge helix DNA binding protein
VAKVTSKLQVTIPKAVADAYGIAAGDEIAFEPAGDAIRVLPPRRRPAETDVRTRLALFDAATERQRARESASRPQRAAGRGWTREDLYEGRGRR